MVRIANGKHTRSGRTTIPAVTLSCCGTPGSLGVEGALYDEVLVLGKLGALGSNTGGGAAAQPSAKDERAAEARRGKRMGGSVTDLAPGKKAESP